MVKPAAKNMARRCQQGSGASWPPSKCAEQPLSAAIWSAATNAVMSETPSTRAGISIAQKVSTLPEPNGLRIARQNFLRSLAFHVVFTVPEEIAAIALQNKDAVYSILFRTTAETLKTIAADLKHLGAEIGFFAILHSWGQNLQFHPHLHCVIARRRPIT